MKPRCFSIITRYTVYCHIAQPCMFDILLGRISYSFVSIFFFTGQVAAPCQAPSATFTLHENLKFLTHFFFVDNCRIMLQVTLRPLFYQSSASVFDTVAWCASNLSWPCYLKFTMADHIIGLLFGKPPVKWLQQRFCEESTLQRSECRCGSSTCSLVGTHCALVWNEPLCAVTLFLWDVKGEDVEVGRHPFPVSLCVFVSVSQVKHSPCNLALGEEPGLGVMWWEGMKGRHIMTDLMIFFILAWVWCLPSTSQICLRCIHVLDWTEVHRFPWNLSCVTDYIFSQRLKQMHINTTTIQYRKMQCSDAFVIYVYSFFVLF